MCRFCGEEIKRIAVRCKHCHTDLSGLDDDDSGSGAAAVEGAPSGDDFEVRFLEYAYRSHAPIYVTAVAHALRVPATQVSERLEDMAARDLILRQIDDEGNVYFALAGHTGQPGSAAAALVPLDPATLAPSDGSPGALTHKAPPSESTAVAAMVLNVMVPGAGSLVAGRVATGVAQLMLWVVGIPLCLLFLMGVPLVMASWVWSLMTGVQIFEQARRRQTPQ